MSEISSVEFGIRGFAARRCVRERLDQVNGAGTTLNDQHERAKTRVTLGRAASESIVSCVLTGVCRCPRACAFKADATCTHGYERASARPVRARSLLAASRGAGNLFSLSQPSLF